MQEETAVKITGTEKRWPPQICIVYLPGGCKPVWNHTSEPFENCHLLPLGATGRSSLSQARRDLAFMHNPNIVNRGTCLNLVFKKQNSSPLPFMVFSIKWFNQVLIQNHLEFHQAHCQYLALLQGLTVRCEDIKVHFKCFLLQGACTLKVH